MLEGDRRHILRPGSAGRRLLPVFCRRVGQAGAHLEDAFDPVSAGDGLCNRNDQVGQLDQLHQDLRHVVDQSDHLTLGDDPVFHLPGPGPDQRDHRAVDDDVGDRVHQGGQPSHRLLHLRQSAVGCFKAIPFALFLIKSTQHPHAGQVFPGDPEHGVQPALYLPVHGGGDDHDAEHHDGQ